jgi:uncharacterized protein YodC (DUF2158 family)
MSLLPEADLGTSDTPPLACQRTTGSRNFPREGNFAQGVRFQSGDRVRSVQGGGQMTVIISFGDEVHCEWLIGTEPQQMCIPCDLASLGPTREGVA